MQEQLFIYHGSEIILPQPIYGAERKNNDFGIGFYCTQQKELAKEWAVSQNKNGYCNCYSLNAKYLNILNLNTSEYSILNWIAILVEHRLFSLNNPIARRAKRYLIDHFSVNVNAYDVIIGYRADDSYFDYAESFLNNSITVEQLAFAMKLGKLGEQVVLKSSFAFDQLSFQNAEVAIAEKYFTLKKERNDSANKLYFQMLENETDGLYIQDIIRQKVQNDDPRIPRNISQ